MGDVADYNPFWATTKHSDILDVERDNETFTNAPRQVLLCADRDAIHADIGIRALIHLDGRQHRLIRAIGADWFGIKA